MSTIILFLSNIYFLLFIYVNKINFIIIIIFFLQLNENEYGILNIYIYFEFIIEFEEYINIFFLSKLHMHFYVYLGKFEIYYIIFYHKIKKIGFIF